ncbi:hypothetical protein AOQ84DRAFT_360732 [Glonium stellatum]|uniref:DUF6590 domain-containing protein n=1 Tax=Glonium stellatum TaxID=574774 RepID=A0A8E2JX27_9PEZI|nr:hypothetical protein AOQ84DRAFT_360732 [Glonium stellatum]
MGIHEPSLPNGKNTSVNRMGALQAPRITCKFSQASAVTQNLRSGYHDFDVGAIINAPHFEPLSDPKIAQGDPSRTESTLGPIITKKRFMIVLAKLPDHMIALPIFSHGDRGIGHKPANVRAQYMGLKMPGNREFKNDTPYPPLEIDGAVTCNLRDTSNVNIMYPITVGYDNRAVIHGSITIDSYAEMVETFQKMLSNVVELNTNK